MIATYQSNEAKTSTTLQQRPGDYHMYQCTRTTYLHLQNPAEYLVLVWREESRRPSHRDLPTILRLQGQCSTWLRGDFKVVGRQTRGAFSEQHR